MGIADWRESTARNIIEGLRLARMGDNKLDWSWFDPLHFWRDLQGLWVEGGVRDHLRHCSWIQQTTQGGGMVDIPAMKSDRGSEKRELHPNFPCNAELRSQFKC